MREVVDPKASSTPERLYTRPFAALCLVTLLGFGSHAVVQTILPLRVLALGGDATLAGAAVAAASAPSVLLRPLIGRLVDSLRPRTVHLIGTALLGVAGLCYLMPSLGFIFITRLLHGTAWAAFATAGRALLAELAPSTRRGEAAGIYHLMPGLSHMAMPSLALALLTVGGFAPVFAVAASLSLVAGLAVWLMLQPKPGQRRIKQGRPARALIEKRALLPMTYEFLFTTSNSLFWVYPPLFAASLNLPLTDLAAYYPVVGIAAVLSRLVVARFIDRIDRAAAILLGAAATTTALLAAAAIVSIPGLAIAGALHALGASLIAPAATAIVMDRVEPERQGAGMATHSLGHQLGLGAGAVIWGVIIDLYGFPAPYVTGVVPQAVLLTLAIRYRKGSRPSSPSSEGTSQP